MTPTESPLPWQLCLDLAWEAYRAGSLPIAAVIVDAEGKAVATGRNRIRDKTAPHPQVCNSSLAHAELNAMLSLDEANVDPRTCTLYTTTEPCPLCMGGIRMMSIKSFHYACRDPWAGCSVMTEVVPYIKQKNLTVTPPQSPDLENCLAALLLECFLNQGLRPTHPFFEAWERVLPVGTRAGQELFDTGVLKGLGSARARTGEMLAVVSEAVAKVARGVTTA